MFRILVIITWRCFYLFVVGDVLSDVGACLFTVRTRHAWVQDALAQSTIARGHLDTPGCCVQLTAFCCSSTPAGRR